MTRIKSRLSITHNTIIKSQAAGTLLSLPTQRTLHHLQAAARSNNKARNSPSLPAHHHTLTVTKRNSSSSSDKTTVKIKSSESTTQEANQDFTWMSKNKLWAQNKLSKSTDKTHVIHHSSAPTNWRTENFVLKSAMENLDWLPADKAPRSSPQTNTAETSMDCADHSMEIKMMTKPHQITRSTLMPSTLPPHGLFQTQNALLKPRRHTKKPCKLHAMRRRTILDQSSTTVKLDANNNTGTRTGQEIHLQAQVQAPQVHQAHHLQALHQAQAHHLAQVPQALQAHQRSHNKETNHVQIVFHQPNAFNTQSVARKSASPSVQSQLAQRSTSQLRPPPNSTTFTAWTNKKPRSTWRTSTMVKFHKSSMANKPIKLSVLNIQQCASAFKSKKFAQPSNVNKAKSANNNQDNTKLMTDRSIS